MNKFENDWKKRMKLFQSNCYDKSIRDLTNAQEAELNEFNNELQYKLNNKNIKWTTQILQARDKELALARLNKFDEAYDIQQHRLRLEQQAFADYQKQMNRKYRTLILQKQQEHAKQMSSLTERLDNSRDELERAYSVQKDQLEKRQRTIMNNFTFTQKKVNTKVSCKNKQRIEKTYVGTFHGHNGTVSKIRPWTFRVNQTNLSPRKAVSKDEKPIPNEDIADIEQYIVAEYKKENRSPTDGKTNIDGSLVNHVKRLNRKNSAKLKRGLSLSSGCSLLDHGNRLTNLISEINNMKLFNHKSDSKPLLDQLEDGLNVESVDLDAIDCDDDDKVESKEEEEPIEVDASPTESYKRVDFQHDGKDKELMDALTADCS